MVASTPAEMVATLKAARDQMDLEHARAAINWDFWHELTATVSPEHLDRVLDLVLRELRSYHEFPDQPINAWPI
jgi:hypothetical protein